MKTITLFLYLALSILTTSVNAIVFKGATIFPSPNADAIDSGDVVIRDGVIVFVGNESLTNEVEAIDLAGKFVTAGFWNSHVHYLFSSSDVAFENKAKLEIRLSEMFLKWGFTHTVDTGSDPEVLSQIDERIKSGEIVGPTIYQIGGNFVPVGGSPFYIAPIKLPEFHSTEQTKELVGAALKSGMDGIKMFSGSWSSPNTVVLMNPDHVKAAVELVHEFGKLTFAHPSDSDGARIAVESGVDVLAHAFPAELKGPWDTTLPSKMKQAGTSLIPTLKLFRYDLERLGLPANIVDRIERNAIAQVAASHQEGCRILFGTDVGYMRDTDTTREFQLMHKAGLNFKDILGTLTTAPATLFKVSHHQGAVNIGYQADLVVLNSDPRTNPAAFADVNMVIRKGKIVYQNEN